MPNTMTLISTVTVASAQANIVYSSIPQTYTDLVLVLSARASGTGFDAYPVTQINSITSGYTERFLSGYNNAAGSGSFTGNGSFLFYQTVPTGNSTANTFSNIQMTFPNYSGATNKSVSFDGVSENNGTLYAHQVICASLLANTAAITSITLGLYIDGVGSSNFVTGSTASLYGILKGSGGATVS